MIELPDWAEFLFQPSRFKVLYGGRGSGKSWAVAMMLLLDGARSPQRILCTREVQKSIKDSVHKLLSDQIIALGLEDFYEILETTIRGRNGTEFSFAGLANHTVASIKSYEGITRCWIEEAQTVSKKSLDILIPTIRAPGSEIIVTFNPELDTDPVWEKFVENPPSYAVVKRINYTDNPWFPDVLEQERIHCKATNPEDYDTIWEGKCRPAVQGAIYASEISSAISEGRITHVPYDPRALVHSVWDLGWNDSMTIVMVQRIGPSALAIIDYIEDSQKTLDWYVAELNKKPYNWGDDWIPHDGTHKDFKTGMSTEQLLKRMKRNPRLTPNIGIEPGIKMARMALKRCYLDKTRAARLIDCLKRYRRSVPASTGEPGSPVHDEYSHGADAFRYLGVVADQLSNEHRGTINIPAVPFTAFDAVAGY
jgi:phage terminase large subunit